MLYLVGTPIGNLDDMTFRAVKTLNMVDLIAAEDTRRTAVLLRHFDVTTPVTSYHEHNKAAKGAFLLEQMQQGKSIALVSDAGMPAISDPGYELVRLCIDHSIAVTAVPGATAFTVGLVLSGLPTDHFVFEGFLPAKQSHRTARLEQLKELRQTLLFYEAPHRLLRTLADMADVLGERQVAVCRELTKRYEQVFRGTLNQAHAHFSEQAPKGEFVVVVQGGEEIAPCYSLSLAQHVEQMMEQGDDKKTAIAKVAKLRGVPKREVYSQVVSEQEEG